jgi:hypothetical protein
MCTVHLQPSSGTREPLLRCLPDGHMPGGQRRRARVRTLGRMEGSSFLPKKRFVSAGREFPDCLAHCVVDRS